MPVARIAPTRPMRMPVTAAPPPTIGPKRLSASPSSCISSPLGCLWALPSSPPPPGRFSLRRVATPTTRPKTGTATTATTAKRIRDAMAMLKMKLLLRYGRWEGRDPAGAPPGRAPRTGTAATATTAKRIRDAMAMLKMKLLLRYGRWEGRDPVGSRPDSSLFYFRRFLMALLALSAPLPEPPVRFLPFLSPDILSFTAFVAASLILLPMLAMLAPLL